MDKDKTSSPLTIRELHSVEDLTLVRELEEIIWADDDAIPIHQTVTAVKNGGLVLGAYLDDQLIGFQYSFAGFDGKTAYLCSHNLGVHPEYRIGGIGEKLKLKQREFAIEKGYNLITWTYDPLETVNGNLNINKLGAVCFKYEENCYGEMVDVLNAGIPSDRFVVDWWITSDHVIHNLANFRNAQKQFADSPAVIEVTADDLGYPVPQNINLDLVSSDGSLLVPVPAAFQQIKKDNGQLALAWRMQTRAVFTHYFQNGWQVMDFVKSDMPDKVGAGVVHYYVLQKKK